jgi:L-iditol 2-dehydrogenase
MAPALTETGEYPPDTCQFKVEKNDTNSTKHLNPSLQVTADHNIEMVEAPIENPGPGDVLIHIKATGICGQVTSYGLNS